VCGCVVPDKLPARHLLSSSQCVVAPIYEQLLDAVHISVVMTCVEAHSSELKSYVDFSVTRSNIVNDVRTLSTTYKRGGRSQKCNIPIFQYSIFPDADVINEDFRTSNAVNGGQQLQLEHYCNLAMLTSEKLRLTLRSLMQTTCILWQY